MKYSEIFTPDFGLFADIYQKENPAFYAQIFGDYDPKILDDIANFIFGEKLINKKFIDVSNEKITIFVKSLIIENAEFWARQKELLTVTPDINTTGGYSDTRTEKITTTANDTGSIVKDNIFFNSTNFENDEQRTTTGNKQKTENRTIANSRNNLAGIGDIITNIKKEIELKTDSVNLIMIRNLINLITLKIY